MHGYRKKYGKLPFRMQMEMNEIVYFVEEPSTYITDIYVHVLCATQRLQSVIENIKGNETCNYI